MKNGIHLTREETEAAAINRPERHQSVAQCVRVDASWIKVKIKVKVIAI